MFAQVALAFSRKGILFENTYSLDTHFFPFSMMRGEYKIGAFSKDSVLPDMEGDWVMHKPARPTPPPNASAAVSCDQKVLGLPRKPHQRAARVLVGKEQRPHHARKLAHTNQPLTGGACSTRPQRHPTNHMSHSKSVTVEQAAVTHPVENALVSRQPPSWQEPPRPWAYAVAARGSEKTSSGRVRAGRERHSPQGREEQSRRAPHRCRLV